MELEELKQAWSVYDKKLTENLKINKKVLKEMNLDRAKSELDIPKKYELTSLAIGIMFFIYILSSTAKFADDIKLVGSGIVTSLMCILLIGLTIYKLKALSKLDFYKDGIVDLQKKLAIITKKYLLSKRIEIYLFPFFLIVASPILAKAIKGYYLFDFPVRYMIAVCSALVLGYPLAIWIYKNWYQNKIMNIRKFMAEIAKFETEQ